MTTPVSADFFVDCPTGLAGDMLLAACLDLGVPTSVIQAPLQQLGLDTAYALRVSEAQSGGLRGLRLKVDALEPDPAHRHWGDLRRQILAAELKPSLRDMVLAVFSNLAEAEAAVHGEAPEQVHFHEVGAIDSLVDVVGVCAAFDVLQPRSLCCLPPPSGRGTVSTAHGVLPVPAPAVLKLAQRHGVTLRSGDDWPETELTTPTGLALMTVLADRFGWPSLLEPESIGIGLGHRQLDRPNLLRLIRMRPRSSVALNQPHWQELMVQEAWIDDASAEAIAWLCEQLRDAGAVDVASAPLQMKKGRPGTSVMALVFPESAERLRQIWWTASPTLGVRERFQGRWVLPRRCGSLDTPWGALAAKQAMKPDGSLVVKPEQDALQSLADREGLSPESLRQTLRSSTLPFRPEEDWTC